MMNIFNTRRPLFVTRRDKTMNRRKPIVKQGTLFMHPEQHRAAEPLTDDERIHAVALSILSSPGANRVWALSASRRPDEAYRAIGAASVPSIQSYLAGVYPADPIEAARVMARKAEDQSIRILTCWDSDYPPLLREIQCPPLVLYVKGSLPEGMAVAVVGTRRADPRSSAATRRLSRELAGHGFAVVSGMAVGIDREAHLGALDAGGRTVGVLANGIDIAYPSPNRDLYRLLESTAGSALVSEYPPGIFAGRWTFVRRNRIISGLCAGTVVVKAGERSGALITARHALEQNREVFACAGAPFEGEYAGCHRLIRDGAVLVSRTEDVIAELMRVPIESIANDPGAVMGAKGSGDDAVGEPLPDSLEGRILGLLSPGDRDIDSIVRELALPAGEVNEAIISLELEGRIRRNGNTVARA